MLCRSWCIKFLLVFLFFLSAGFIHYDIASANDVENLTKEISTYKAANDYAKAIEKAKLLVKLQEKKHGIANEKYASSLNLLGQLMYEDGSYSEAEPVLKQALSIDEKVLDANHPNIVRDLKLLAELYYALVRFDEADRLTARANKIAQK